VRGGGQIGAGPEGFVGVLGDYDLREEEPVFVNLLRSPGIDSQPSWPVRRPYLAYRTGPPGYIGWRIRFLGIGCARIFKLLRSPGIDSKESIPPAHVTWRASTITLFLLGS
jgi:hypothetical protein